MASLSAFIKFGQKQLEAHTWPVAKGLDNVNKGALMVSSKWKWLGIIKIVAQVVLGQQLVAYFRMCRVVSYNHRNITGSDHEL